MVHPYSNLPANAFWKTGVAQLHAHDISGLWSPKFHIRPSSKVATFGSCFAQHIGRALRSRGYTWYVEERPPFGMSPENASRLNYDVFSCRTGNIYTTSLLKQWAMWAAGDATPPEEYWEKDGRIIDPFRPRIEDFATTDEMFKSRQETIRSFRACIENCDFFVFTLGLTESWKNTAHGYEYPMCPGTVAGVFDPDAHTFFNHDYTTARQDLAAAIKRIREINPRVRFLLTVSPVPLTATASGHHVLVATSGSKAVLRAVAGNLADLRPDVDYFASYEKITAHPFRGTAFEPSLREVSSHGVRSVMDSFFSDLHQKFGEPAHLQPAAQATSADEVCEEVLLDAFAGGR